MERTESVSSKKAAFTLRDAASLRVRLGLDKTELAILSGVSVDSVRKIEGGEFLKKETVYKIYNALVSQYRKQGIPFEEKESLILTS